MRAVILFAAIIIAIAINPQHEMSQKSSNFIACVVMGAMVMDIVEFLHNLFKK